jgi:DNA-binding transcriptional MocR family regulator
MRRVVSGASKIVIVCIYTKPGSLNLHVDRGSSRSGGCPSQLTATFIYDMLATSNLQQHVFNVLQPAYFRRFHKMLKAIQEDLLPLGVTMPRTDHEVAGGYFIWLTLPHGLSAEALAKRSLGEESLVIAPGPMFKVQGDNVGKGMNFESDFRLCFSYLEEDLVVEGVHRLGKVLRKVLQEKGVQKPT